MKPHWSNKNCTICSCSFVDKSNAQKAKFCSKTCCARFHKKTISEYSKNRRAKPEIKERERANNKAWYEVYKAEQKIKAAEWTKNNRPTKNALQAQRRAAKLKQTPKWLTPEQREQIKRFYTVAKWVESILGEPIEVDHIVPLQGEKVKGLHVPWNLQLLTKIQNISKSNKLFGN